MQYCSCLLHVFKNNAIFFYFKCLEFNVFNLNSGITILLYGYIKFVINCILGARNPYKVIRNTSSIAFIDDVYVNSASSHQNGRYSSVERQNKK